MLTLPWFMDHILRPLWDPAWPIPILKDSSDVTLVGSDDKQNNAHEIILAWPDRSKMGWPALLGVVRAIQLEPVRAMQLGPANLVRGSYAIMDRGWGVAPQAPKM